MEGGDQSIGNVRSRWNPTKEQINMLEGMYKQGLRNPSAEQIQQITSRLAEVGHIEGKNVFYWFQNRKARQRQKQKQEENSAFFGHLYHSTSSPFAPYHNDKCALLESSLSVVCTPYHVPVPVPTHADLAMYHQQHSKVQLPAAGGCFKRRLISPESAASQRYNHMMHMNKCEQETLELFPMHPTGTLQAKNEGKKEAGKNHEDRPFYDFFSEILN